MTGARGGDQVFSHAQAGKTAPPFRHQPKAKARGTETGKNMQVLAGKFQPALRRDHPANGLDGGGLAHAIAAHQRQNLALGQREIHPEQGLRGAVTGSQVFDPQQCHALSPR